MRRFTGLLALLVLGGVAWVGTRGLGTIPPLGQLLDPWSGVWAAARRVNLPPDVSAPIPNLTGPVNIQYDRRGVPHIFASTELDAVRALGWAVARDRLFELEAQIQAARGRTTEWVGAAALPLDREMRRLGLPAAAERQFATLTSGNRALDVLNAYADGVNAWIDGMYPADVPVEYRLLGVEPQRWEPGDALYLFGRMGWTLTYGPNELRRPGVAALVGKEAAAALFPPHAVVVEPIQPAGPGHPRFDFRPLPPPGEPGASDYALASLLPGGSMSDEATRWQASNNWAVSARRSASGNALLAGDPHLDMTLPSLWYEAHLVVPGRLDVYGVTIPGTPGIVIGFTPDVAWSLTNTGADVVDFYRETVDDSANPTRYRVDGEWRSLDVRIEEYRGRDGRVLGVDTLRFTHRGPMSHSATGEWLSLRWTVLDQKLAPEVFLDAAQARSAREFLDVIASGWGAPAQNMIAADRSGSIAIRSTGQFPIRPEGASGMAIQDGSSSANDWKGFWPVERYPQSLDPAQGFLASANQEPLDPRVNPDYLGIDGSFDPWRALRINALLRVDSAVTVDAMRRYQTDPGSERARLFVPFFLNAARREGMNGASVPSAGAAADWLSGWDLAYTKDNKRSILFETAMQQLSRRTWDELRDSSGVNVATPASDMLLNLLQYPESPWWDDRTTRDRVESMDDILTASLAAAYDSLIARFGPPESGGWRWSVVGATRVDHLLGLAPFSVHDIAVQGGAPGTLNPSSRGGHGPSWRMVVELSDPVRAWGTYPGGQSGNPFSLRYADRLPLWEAGELDTLLAPRDTTALAAPMARAHLTPAGRKP